MQVVWMQVCLMQSCEATLLPYLQRGKQQVWMEKGKGKADAPSQSNKPAPKKKTPAPPAPHLTLNPTEALVAAVACPPPSDAHKVAHYGSLPVTLHDVVQDPIPHPQPSGNCRSRHLNTIKKHNIQRGILDTVHDRT
jgi:hypothetical protein